MRGFCEDAGRHWGSEEGGGKGCTICSLKGGDIFTLDTNWGREGDRNYKFKLGHATNDIQLIELIHTNRDSVRKAIVKPTDKTKTLEPLGIDTTSNINGI